MALTRRQLVTGFSVLYLLALTILAGYALRSTDIYNLPIPDVISALTIALPPLAGVAMETSISMNEKLAARGQLQTSRIFQITMAFFLVYETALATLAGTHISPPGSLNCHLRETWEKLFRAKDESAVRMIQDTFSCCGFASTSDMAFPFPDANHHADACIVRFERETPCIEAWRNEERKVAVFLLVVPVAVFLWMVAIALSPSSQSSWLQSQLSLASGGTAGSSNRRARPEIEYRDVEGGEEDSIYQEVNNLNKDSRLATEVEGNRTRSSNGIRHEQDVWRERA